MSSVVHFVKRYCELSETFVYDVVTETDRLGWSAWIATRSLANRDVYPFPEDERILVGSRPSLASRVVGRATRLPEPERRARWLEAQVRDAAPTVLHAHFGWMGLDALPVARALGIPLLVSFHASDVLVHPRMPDQALHYRRLIAALGRVTVVSDFIGSKLRELGYRGRTDLVPAGVRLDQFRFRGPRPTPGPVRLLFVGRQVRRKGLDVLLCALPTVAAEHDVRLDVIGAGPLALENKTLAAELGVADRVSFHGGRPQSEVRAAMEAADVLVMPSLSPPSGEAEGSPVTTKEALAIGLPVVATVNGGIPETIPPQYRHELVAEGDHDGLAARIVDVLDHRDGWSQRAVVGRRFVEEQFDTAVLARRICAIYDGMSRGGRASHGANEALAG